MKPLVHKHQNPILCCLEYCRACNLEWHLCYDTTFKFISQDNTRERDIYTSKVLVTSKEVPIQVLYIVLTS